MSAPETLAAAFRSPTAEAVWQLRAELLAERIPSDSRVWNLLGEYHRFLDQIARATTSRDYSDLASKLDIGSISGVIVERLLEPKTARELAVALLTGALSEGLMVLATRQHVKAWEEGLESVYRDAAWFLYGELWRWAEEQKPELPPSERRRLLDRLLRPVLARETPGFSKALLLGRLFQLLLLSHLA
jgi:hypothetical protein